MRKGYSGRTSANWFPSHNSSRWAQLRAHTLRILTLLLVSGGFLSTAIAASAQSFSLADHNIPKPIPLYKGTPPGALGHGPRDIPKLYAMLPKKPVTNAAILVIPGGGYQEVALGHEGLQIGNWLRAQGMPAIILDYRVAPYHYPVELEDGVRAMKVIRSHAKEWKVDPDRIGVWGFSAGGHLASTLATHCNQPTPDALTSINFNGCRTGLLILSYPVISMRKSITHHGSREALLGPHPSGKLVSEFSNELRVTPETPPTFLFVTQRDPVVPVQNSLDFFRALVRNHVPAELHVYDYGLHGCGLCGSNPQLRSYPSLLREWLMARQWLPADAPQPPAPAPKWPDWPAPLEGPGMPPSRK